VITPAQFQLRAVHYRRDIMSTSTTVAQTDATAANAGDRPSTMCAVCPHPEDAHDPISLRYCAATVVGAWQRGCVCGGGHTTIHRPRIAN
jgi:hypothetical protein